MSYPDLEWAAQSPENGRLWFAAWNEGADYGVRSRPTDEEIAAYVQEQVERAYREGYADGLAVHQHKEDARVLTQLHKIALDRQRSAYIPRERVA